MSDSLSTGEQHAAYQLLGYYGELGGFAPGGFVETLIRCFEKADMVNTVKLETVFPEMGWAVLIMKRDGPDGLRAALRGDETDEY